MNFSQHTVLISNFLPETNCGFLFVNLFVVNGKPTAFARHNLLVNSAFVLLPKMYANICTHLSPAI